MYSLGRSKSIKYISIFTPQELQSVDHTKLYEPDMPPASL